MEKQTGWLKLNMHRWNVPKLLCCSCVSVDHPTRLAE